MKESLLKGIRVFLLDDHPAIRDGLSALLSDEGAEIVGEAGSSREAKQLLETVSADLVLVDLSLGDESGLELVRFLKLQGISSLIYSMHGDAWNIRTALSAGAHGYVTKREMTDVLKEAIHVVLADEVYLSPAVVSTLNAQSPLDEERRLLESLSLRELDIFQLLGEGYSTPDIAEELKLAISTVETNLSRIIFKLDFSGTKDLRRFAIQCQKKKTEIP